MGWRPEERSSSDVGQWTTLLRRLLGHFAISTTSVECYGLSHACFYLRLSSNVTTRVWIDNLYHIKPGKYHGVGTLRSHTGLGKSDHNGEVTLLQGVICTVEYNLGLSQSDCNGEVILLVR